MIRIRVPDDILVENFVISDLPAGTCRVWAETPGELVEQSVEILPGELSRVVFRYGLFLFHQSSF